MQQILLQDILLQNAIVLLQNATLITKCVSTSRSANGDATRIQRYYT